MEEFFKKILYGGGILFDFFKWIVVAGIILLLINTFWVAVFVVDGESMEPNFHDKELVLWQRNAYTSEDKNPERGEIVIVKYPGDPKNKKYVKRVVGLPGENITIRNGEVFIDSKLLRENYISYEIKTEPNGSWQLKDEEYLILGDNRPYSNDSRYFGPVEKRFVLGKALTIVFPRFRTVADL